MDDGPNNNKGKSSGEGEVKYRGVRKRKWGKYEVYIRYKDRSRNKNPIYLGSFSTAEEAAKVFDKEAYKTWGHSAILNFPQDHNLPSTSSYFAQPSTPSGSQQKNEVFEIEYYENQLLEDLLGDTCGSQLKNEVFEIEYYDNKLLEDLLDDKKD